MVIASRFLHRFGQIMIRFNHNKTAKLTQAQKLENILTTAEVIPYQS